MQVAPYVLGIRSERERVQIEISCVVVFTLEGMGNPKVDPHSHVVGTNVQCSVVELNGLVCSPQVRKSGSYFVHK